MIAFSVIVYLLSIKHEIKGIKSAYFDAPISSVKKYRGEVRAKHLYCIPVQRFKELKKHPVLVLKESSFICWGNSADDTAEWERLYNPDNMNMDVVYLDNIELGDDILEEVMDIILRFNMWEKSLDTYIKTDEVDIDNILNIAKRLIKKPLAVFDKTFVMLGHTEGYLDYFPDMRDRIIDSQLSHSDIKKLIQNEEYIVNDEQKGVFLYQIDPGDEKQLCYNIYVMGEFSARVMIVVPDIDIHPGIKKLFEIFIGYFKTMYLNNLDNYLLGNQDDMLHQLFKKYLFHSRSKEQKSDFQILSNYNWYRHDEYQIIILRIFASNEFEKGSSYFCQQLERFFEHSCTYRTDREIIWIINYTRETAVKNKDDFYTSFPYIIRDFGCKAGISDFFNDFALVSNYRRQADIALEIGNKKDSYKWYYAFNDYVTEYMFEQVTTLFTAEQLMHKGLIKLLDYDKEHGTEFVKTLYVYISSRFNASCAAEKLYIHRTTFIRRLERIEELISIDFNNSDEMLYIMISYKLFDRKEKLDE